MEESVNMEMNDGGFLNCGMDLQSLSATVLLQLLKEHYNSSQSSCYIIWQGRCPSRWTSLYEAGCVMQWKPEHDAIFLREVLASDLYSIHKGSSDRGKIWSQLAEKLNEVSSCKFNVTQKSLRDRLKLLTQKHKQKMRSEKRASERSGRRGR